MISNAEMANLAKENKSYYCENITTLYNEGLYTNVTALGPMILTICERSPELLPPQEQLQVLSHIGDSCYNLIEFARADIYYRKALQMFKYLVKSHPHLKEVLTEEVSSEIKYKIHLCHVMCKRPLEALSMLQSIPAKCRTAKVNMALGKLYLNSGMERAAITSFKEVLREIPMAIEAAENLLMLGVKECDVKGFIHQKSKQSHPEWYYTWLKGNSYLYARDYPEALKIFNHLHERTSLQCNHSVLVAIGTTHFMSGEYKKAINPLTVAHSSEIPNMRGMDLLAYSLWHEKRTMDLDKLMVKLTDVAYTDMKSEPWVATAYYAHGTNRSTRAIYFAHRAATAQGMRHLEGLLAKGHILLELKKHQEAVICFREAMTINTFRFEPHKGIVDCYIALNRYRDALTIATVASKKLGQTPRVLTVITRMFNFKNNKNEFFQMCASALKKDPLTTAKAKSYLEKALNQDPSYIPAIFMLVDIYEQGGQYAAAIEILNKQVKSQINPPQLHLKLANLLCKNNMEDKAADHFAIALRLDPSNRDAKEGLNKLDPAARLVTHDTQTSYELGEDVDLDEDDDDAEQADSEVEASLWSSPDFNLNTSN